MDNLGESHDCGNKRQDESMHGTAVLVCSNRLLYVRVEAGWKECARGTVSRHGQDGA